MKKLLVTLTVAIMLFSLATTACAYDTSWGSASGWWNWWHKYAVSAPEDTESENTESEVIDLQAPAITKATYSHGSGLKNTLQVYWDEVDGAERYEVEITKADGSCKVYTTTSACLFVKAGSDEFLTGCPTIYIAETSTWTSADVRVRAQADNSFSDWSSTAKIGCNTLHCI